METKMNTKSILILASIFLLSSCAPGDLNAHDAWARPTDKGGTAAAYFLIHNHTPNSDELIGASSSISENVEIHQSKLVDDVMKMEMIQSLALAPGDEYSFEPGGLHVMLIGIKDELKSGDRFDLTLDFKNHEDITLQVEVTDQVDAGSGHTHP
jgi:copper(I)-binding protein